MGNFRTVFLLEEKNELILILRITKRKTEYCKQKSF